MECLLSLLGSSSWCWINVRWKLGKEIAKWSHGRLLLPSFLQNYQWRSKVPRILHTTSNYLTPKGLADVCCLLCLRKYVHMNDCCLNILCIIKFQNNVFFFKEFSIYIYLNRSISFLYFFLYISMPNKQF